MYGLRAECFRWRFPADLSQGEWAGPSAGGCLNYLGWRFNPQVFLRVKVRRMHISFA